MHQITHIQTYRYSRKLEYKNTVKTALRDMFNSEETNSYWSVYWLLIFSCAEPDAITLFCPARRYASVGNSDRNVSVFPSVCLSVTRRYCVKTKKASGMISSPSGSPKTLVFWRQISSPNSKGFPPNGGLKQGLVVKIQRLASCNVSISTGY